MKTCSSSNWTFPHWHITPHSNMASIHTTLYYQSTFGTWKTTTPNFRSSGPLSREQALTGETRHAAICVWRRRSAYYQLTDPPSWTKDLSLLPSAGTKTSTTWPIRDRIVPTVLHEHSLNCISPHLTAQSDDRFVHETLSNCRWSFYL